MSDLNRAHPNGIFQIRIWGARGGLPISGPEFSIHGGNTICIEMRCGGHVLIFDAGSGLFPAGCTLKSEGLRKFDLFFSHCHYDHIVGLPFFSPLYDRTASGTIWSGHLNGKMTTEQMISGFMRPPWFPVEQDVFDADFETRDFEAGDDLHPQPGITIKTDMLNHPGNSIGYRVEWGGRAVAMITDTEHEPGSLDESVLRLIEDCDLFLYDSNYTDAEMQTYRGFGHSTWQQGIRLARESGARRVGFIHHAQWRTDAQIEDADRKAKAEFPASFFARDGQIIDL